jgi:hypothetical protein
MSEDPKPPKPFIPPESNEETRLYWDRLDARFANINVQPPATSPVPTLPVPPAPPAAPAPPAVPARVDAPSAVAPLPPSSPATSAAGPRLIADAFAALLALEDGQPGAKPVRLTIGDGHQTPAAEPKITDAVIDDIVRRVVERLGPDAVRAVVTDVVSDVSERLVKEEIARIRKQHV